ncbi:hypothetical protein BFJ66_g6473 [Fusarium oxysporum f. sp. cepae]|jgi:hypothetical protein|uniref:Uncharacterized protein n=1 Tax=Fusarium oxysporum f. sp. cepae TaxID=396571 RepID=A0A3L6NQP5_FUSOX|nr:hypothetical protein BFJ65_g6992 [Fusarium oxysporum f. sp. cepae]RKK48330.1 hypothetical protein BFJ67_g7440 [Fusarium oxysporum f. sp. cepae]RKK50622.1 hypothetical protein BFJ66_g6473 [Fusarium oxysporum f. sp. cepae]RKK98863.1 hypothetical protein BFJ71_g6588 [Fusarium oxysporum]
MVVVRPQQEELSNRCARLPVWNAFPPSQDTPHELIDDLKQLAYSLLEILQPSSLTSATAISKTGPPSNQNKTTGQLEASHLVREKRKEAALGRQRAHARADTSEMNMVAMDDPTDGLRWAFHLTLSGLWDSFLPSPTSQVTYIAFEFLKH